MSRGSRCCFEAVGPLSLSVLCERRGFIEQAKLLACPQRASASAFHRQTRRRLEALAARRRKSSGALVNAASARRPSHAPGVCHTWYWQKWCGSSRAICAWRDRMLAKPVAGVCFILERRLLHPASRFAAVLGLRARLAIGWRVPSAGATKARSTRRSTSQERGRTCQRSFGREETVACSRGVPHVVVLRQHHIDSAALCLGDGDVACLATAVQRGQVPIARWCNRSPLFGLSWRPCSIQQADY